MVFNSLSSLSLTVAPSRCKCGRFLFLQSKASRASACSFSQDAFPTRRADNQVDKTPCFVHLCGCVDIEFPTCTSIHSVQGGYIHQMNFKCAWAALIFQSTAHQGLSGGWLAGPLRALCLPRVDFAVETSPSAAELSVSL